MKKTKVCCICKVDKELINYHKNKCSNDGLQTRCKSCSNLDKEYRKNYYQQNKESLAPKQKERELENKESIRLNKKKKYQEKLRADGKVSKKQEIEKRRKKIKALLEQDFKRKDICSQLDISIKTYKRDISFLKEQGLI